MLEWLRKKTAEAERKAAAARKEVEGARRALEASQRKLAFSKIDSHLQNMSLYATFVLRAYKSDDPNLKRTRLEAARNYFQRRPRGPGSHRTPSQTEAPRRKR